MVEYLQFVRGLDNSTFREVVRRDQVALLPPYDALLADVLELAVVTPDQVDKVAKLYLHPDDVSTLSVMESDPQLALNSYKRLVHQSIRDEAVKQLEYTDDINDSLDKVSILLDKRHVFIPQHRAKGWEELDERDDDVLMEFAKYNLSRGKLSLLAAFSGIGKTTFSLCLANAASLGGLTVLIIAIKDWSESELKRKTSILPNKENVAFAVYGECALTDIDYEIKMVQPDLVIVDALTDIDMPLTEKYHRTIGDTAASLRAMAVKYDCHLFTTHQTGVLEPLVLPGHLRDSKSNLIQSLDIGWGLGSKGVAESLRIMNTIKIRHQESVRPWKLVFDYSMLELQDKGLYNEKGVMFKR